MRKLQMVMLAAAVLSIFVSSGVQSQQSPSATSRGSGTPEKEVTIRISVLPIINSWAVFVGQDKGFFAAENIKLEFKRVASGAEAASAMVGGSLDIALTSNIVSVVQANEQGYDLNIISNNNIVNKKYPYIALMVPYNSPYKTARDLVGKTFATNSLKGNIQMYAEAWMKKNGEDPAKVKFAEMPFPSMESAMKSGSIDVALNSDPFVTGYLDRNVARVLSWHHSDASPGGEALVGLTIASRKWEDNNVDALKRFLRALNKGIDFVRANEQGEAMDILAKNIRVPLATVKRFHLTEFRKGVDEKLLQESLDLMTDLGYSSKKLSAKNYISPYVIAQ